MRKTVISAFIGLIASVAVAQDAPGMYVAQSGFLRQIEIDAVLQ
jgi:hypothetical protein